MAHATVISIVSPVRTTLQSFLLPQPGAQDREQLADIDSNAHPVFVKGSAPRRGHGGPNGARARSATPRRVAWLLGPYGRCAATGPGRRVRLRSTDCCAWLWSPNLPPRGLAGSPSAVLTTLSGPELAPQGLCHAAWSAINVRLGPGQAQAAFGGFHPKLLLKIGKLLIAHQNFR